MSKSLKNYITIKVKAIMTTSYNLIKKIRFFFLFFLNVSLILPHQDFLKSYSATEFRMFCLLTKYRSGGRCWMSASKPKRFLLPIVSVACFPSDWLQRWQHVGGPQFSGIHLQLRARRSGLHEGAAPMRGSTGSLSVGEVPPHRSAL